MGKKRVPTAQRARITTTTMHVFLKTVYMVTVMIVTGMMMVLVLVVTPDFHQRLSTGFYRQYDPSYSQFVMQRWVRVLCTTISIVMPCGVLIIHKEIFCLRVRIDHSRTRKTA